jgi:hypothetical protein
MNKFSMKKLLDQIHAVSLRFPFTLFFILGLTFLFFLKINKPTIEILPSRWVFFSISIALSLVVTLFSEEFKGNLIKIGLNLLLIIVLMIYCYFLPAKFEPVNFYQTISVGIVLILSAFVVPFLKKNNDIPFWEFGKTSVLQLIISGFFALVLYAGLMLAVFSLKELFKIEIHQKVYEQISVICFVLFAPLYFLTHITEENNMHTQEFTFNQFVRILGLYILLPILLLYCLILYVYLVQIVVKWQLPNGWVSTLVSVLGLGGFLCMFILYPLRLSGENKVASLLSKYFPIILLPLLVLMSIGILRRFEDYGVTINRLYVIILNAWLYGICVYLILSKSNHLKWIVISFVTVLFVASVGPWSVYKITERKMIGQISHLLDEAKLLKDGKVIDNTGKTIKLNPQLADTLSEDVKYVYNNYGVSKLQPLFRDSIGKKGWTQVFQILGIGELPVKDTYFNAWIDRKNSTLTDINTYHSFVYLPGFNSGKTEILNNSTVDIKMKDLQIEINTKSAGAKTFKILLKPKLKEIIQLYKAEKSFSMEKMTIENENSRLIINSVHGNYYSQNDSIYISDCDALLFLK